MDFKCICLVLIFVSHTFFVAGGRRSKCLNSKGELKCKDGQECMDKKKNICEYPYLGRRCKCKTIEGCVDSRSQPGCDYGKICMSNDVLCEESEYNSKKCSCVTGCTVAIGLKRRAILPKDGMVKIKELCLFCNCQDRGNIIKEYCRDDPDPECNVVANMLRG